MKITQDIIKEYLIYNPETGKFTWTDKQGKRGVKPSREAGCIDGGYIKIRMGKINYRAHRLAWIYMTGNQPPDYIDHINHDGTDNRWCNIRAATATESACNIRISSLNTSGFKGVCRYKDGGYVARIWYKNVRIYLGRYPTKEEAYAAYCEASKKYHGEFGCIG